MKFYSSLKIHYLVSWDELLGEVPGVHGTWIGQVVVQVLEWSFSGHDGLDEESEHGEHSKTSVLDLLHLELSEGIWVVSQTQWVEWTTWVKPVKTLSPVEASWGVTEGLSLSHQDHLACHGGHNGLGVDQVGVSEVVQSIVREDGGSGLEPHGGITELGSSVVLEQLWGDASKGTQHSPASVDQFQLTVLGESLWVSRESGSVPTVVSWELSVQVAWDGTLRERSQEQWALRSIPLRLGRAGWLGLRTSKALLFRFSSLTS